ncbi:unnamed protein product, partial [Brachionus calyciflorus]
EYASKNLSNASNKKIIYQRIDKTIKFNNCLKDNEFFSLDKYSCLQCPLNFKKYSGFPYACYLKLSVKANYTDAKFDCEQKGGFLARPKSFIERSFLRQLYSSSQIWIDSKITRLNEEYKWNDGTKVGGFAITEPNNVGENSSNLNENVILMQKGEFNDYSDSAIKDVVCQFS